LYETGPTRWLSAGLSLSRSHHWVQSLSLCLYRYTGVTTLHKGTIPIAAVLHSATELVDNKTSCLLSWTCIQKYDGYRGLHPNGSRDQCYGSWGKQTPTTTRSRRETRHLKSRCFVCNVLDRWVHKNSAWVCAIFTYFLVVGLSPNEMFAPPSTWKVSVRCEVITYVFVFPH